MKLVLLSNEPAATVTLKLKRAAVLDEDDEDMDADDEFSDEFSDEFG